MNKYPDNMRTGELPPPTPDPAAVGELALRAASVQAATEGSEGRPADQVAPPGMPGTVYITQRNLKAICRENGLGLGNTSWESLAALPTEVPLLSETAKGEARVSMTGLDDALRSTYGAPKTKNWDGAGNKSMRTFNVLANHFVDHEADTPQPPALRTNERGHQTIRGKDVSEFAKQIGVKVSPTIVSRTLLRIVPERVFERYSTHCRLFPVGLYTADDMEFRIRKETRHRYADDLDGMEIGIGSIADVLDDDRTLERVSMLPKVHYALLRYVKALRQHDMMPEPVIPTPPSHPSVSDEFKPREVPAVTLWESEYGGEHFNDKQDSAHRWLPEMIRRYAKEDFYYPLSALFDRLKGEDPSNAQLMLSKSRLTRFLDTMLAEDAPDPRHTLITKPEFQKLIDLDITQGTREELPQANYIMTGTWPDGSPPEPELDLELVSDFANQLGRPISAAVLHSLLSQQLSENYLLYGSNVYIPGEIYTDRGTMFTVGSLSDASMPRYAVAKGMTAKAAQRYLFCPGRSQPREMFVLRKYLKALYQQGVLKNE